MNQPLTPQSIPSTRSNSWHYLFYRIFPNKQTNKQTNKLYKIINSTDSLKLNNSIYTICVYRKVTISLDLSSVILCCHVLINSVPGCPNAFLCRIRIAEVRYSVATGFHKQQKLYINRTQDQIKKSCSTNAFSSYFITWVCYVNISRWNIKSLQNKQQEVVFLRNEREKLLDPG